MEGYKVRMYDVGLLAGNSESFRKGVHTMKTSNIKMLLAATVIGGAAALFSGAAQAQMLECLECSGHGGGGVVGFEKDPGPNLENFQNLKNLPFEAISNIIEAGTVATPAEIKAVPTLNDVNASGVNTENAVRTLETRIH
jgi:hypothetical protein